MAYYAVFAACAVTLAAVPLVVWLADRRAGRRPALAWRLVTVAGVTLATLAVAWGVQTWANPPHNLRQCFTDYRSGGERGHICEAGLVNRALGLRRLDEGLAGAFVVLSATALLAARLALPPGAEISPPAATR